MGENGENSQIPWVTARYPSGHYLYYPLATMCTLRPPSRWIYCIVNIFAHIVESLPYGNCICDVVSNFHHLIQFFFSLQNLFGTPLMVAAWENDPIVCQVLLDKEADVNLPDSVSLFSMIFKVFLSIVSLPRLLGGGRGNFHILEYGFWGYFSSEKLIFRSDFERLISYQWS